MKRRPLSEEEKAEYKRLTENSKQIEMDVEALMAKPVVYGYARVSTVGQDKYGYGLQAQREQLEEAGAEFIYSDTYTGTTTDRPQLNELMEVLKAGDTLIITKLDRIARSVREGSELIQNLVNKGVNIKILNMGEFNNTPQGLLYINMMLAFAQFERDMIMQRTREGKEVARKNPDYREGRKPVYTKEQIDHALDLLNSYSYKQVVQLTGISKSTLIRAVNKKQESRKQ